MEGKKYSLDSNSGIELEHGSTQVHPWFADVPVAEEDRLFVQRNDFETDAEVNFPDIKEGMHRFSSTSLTGSLDETFDDTTNSNQISTRNDEPGSVKKFVNSVVRSDIGVKLIKFKEGLANFWVSTTCGLKWYQVGNRTIIVIKNSKRIQEIEFDYAIVQLYSYKNHVFIATSDRQLRIYDCSDARGQFRSPIDHAEFTELPVMQTEGHILSVAANDECVAILHRPLDANKTVEKDQLLGMLKALTFYPQLESADFSDSEMQKITWPIPMPLVSIEVRRISDGYLRHKITQCLADGECTIGITNSLKLFIKMRVILQVWQLDANARNVAQYGDIAEYQEMAKHWVPEILHPESCKPVKILAYDWNDFYDSQKLVLAVNDKFLAMLVTKTRIDIYDLTDLSKLGEIKGEFTQLQISNNILIAMTEDNKIKVYDARDRNKIYQHKVGIDASLVNFEMDSYVQVLLENQLLISFNPFEKEPENPPCADHSYTRSVFIDNRYVLWSYEELNFEIVNLLGSFSNNEADEKSSIDMSLEKTNIPEFDEIYDEVIEINENVSKLQESLNSAISDFEELCHIKCIRDHTIRDAFQVMLISLWARNGGDWSKLEAEVKTEPPFIEIAKEKIDPCNHAILDAFERVVAAASEIVEKAETLQPKLEELTAKCTEFPDKVSSVVQDENLEVLDKAKAIKITASNVDKISKATEMLTDLIKTGKDTLDTLSKCVSMVTEEAQLNVIQRSGKHAHVAKAVTLEKLVYHHFPEITRVQKTLQKAGTEPCNRIKSTEDDIKGLVVSPKYIIVCLKKGEILYYDFSGILEAALKLDDEGKNVWLATSNSKYLVLYVKYKLQDENLNEVIQKLIVTTDYRELEQEKWWIEYLPLEGGKQSLKSIEVEREVVKYLESNENLSVLLNDDNNLVLYSNRTHKAIILLDKNIKADITSISKEQCIFLDLEDGEIIGMFKNYIIVTDHKSCIKLIDICTPQKVYHQYYFLDTRIVETWDSADGRFVLMLSHSEKNTEKNDKENSEENDENNADEIDEKKTEKHTVVYALDVLEYGVHKIFSTEGIYEHMAVDRNHLYLIEKDTRKIKSWKWHELLPQEYYHYVRCVFNQSDPDFQKALLHNEYDEYYNQFKNIVSFPSLISLPHIFAQVKDYGLLKKAQQDGIAFIRSQSNESAYSICLKDEAFNTVMELLDTMSKDPLLQEISSAERTFGDQCRICEYMNTFKNLLPELNRSQINNLAIVYDLLLMRVEAEPVALPQPLITLDASWHPIIKPKDSEDDSIPPSAVDYQKSTVPIVVNIYSHDWYDMMDTILNLQDEKILETDFVWLYTDQCWQQAKRMLQGEGIFTAFYTLVLTLHVLYVHSDRSEADWVDTILLYAIAFFDFLTLLYSFGEILIERKQWVKDIWNLVDLAMEVFTTLYLVQVFFTDDSDVPKSTTLALATLFNWTRLMSFYRLFGPTRYLIRMLIEIFWEIKYFITIILSFVLAISFVLMAIREDSDFELYWQIAYRITFGDFEDEYASVPERIVFLFVTITLPLIAMNLLIAIISDKFEQILAGAKIADVRETLSLTMEVSKFLTKKKKYEMKYFHWCSTALMKTSRDGEQWEGRVKELQRYVKEVHKVLIHRTDALEQKMDRQFKELHEEINRKMHDQGDLNEKIDRLLEKFK